MSFCAKVVGWWVGGVCTVIFVSNPTTVLRLCCVVVGVAGMFSNGHETVKRLLVSGL